MEKRLFWTSDVYEMFPNEKENKEQYLEFCEMNDIEIDPDNISENDLYNYLYETNGWYFGDFKTEIKCYERNHGEATYLVCADLGFWYGRRAGGKIIEGMINVIDKVMDDSASFYEEDGRMIVCTANHDGSSSFEIKELTEEGIQFADDWEYDALEGDDAKFNKLTEQEMHEKLFNDDKYSREVSMFKEIYGWN